MAYTNIMTMTIIQENVDLLKGSRFVGVEYMYATGISSNRSF